MTSWSDPNPGILGPEIVSRMQVHNPDIGSMVSSIMRERARQREEAQQTVQQVASSVAQMLDQQRKDKIASVLMQQYGSDPMAQSLAQSGGRPADQLQAYMAAKDRDLKLEQIRKAIATQEAHKAAYDRMGTAKAAVSGDSRPVVDDKTGLIWNGKQWTHPVKQAPEVPDDVWNRYSKLTAALQDTDKDKAKAANIEMGTLQDRYPGLMAMHAPKDVYDPSAAIPEAAAGKPLDQATAAAILKEAGGDADKAREIARARGYVF